MIEHTDPKDSVSRDTKIFICSSLLLILLLSSLFVIGSATRSDLNGEKVTHTNCNVTEKKTNYYFNGKTTQVSSYGLETSCGDFKTDYSIYQDVQKDVKYNLTASVGNWANDPTVTFLEVAK